MKKSLAATAIAALACMTGAANAADVYAPGYKDAPVAPYPSWNGYYIGAFVGGAWATADFTDLNFLPNATFSNSTSGVFGGGQVGYAYQLGHVVMGPEFDFGGVGLSHTARETAGLAAVSTVDNGFYFDITGRLGYAFNQALIYAKGGYAYYDGGLTLFDGLTSVDHKGLSGWTVGGGIEYKFTPAWSVKAEYQYFEFTTAQLVTPAGFTFDNSSFDVNTFKVGVNYYFCNTYQPLK